MVAEDLAAQPDAAESAGRQELYLYLPNGMGRAKLPQALTRHTAKAPGVATARNWRTTTTLLDLARQAGTG